METRERRSIIELLHQERYSPSEVARLLGMSVDRICQAAFRGDLRALIVGHDVVELRRSDILAWLDSDQPHASGGRSETVRRIPSS